MEVTSPPAGSKGYGVPVKAPNGDIYVGVTGSYTQLARIEDVEFIYVNVKDYGAVGDGVTDDTNAFNDALAEAKSTNNFLYFPDGTYPITVSADSVDMNGCLGLVGKGELLLTSTGNPDRPIMKWEGQKERIGSSIPVSKGQRDFVIDTGKDIKKGDTIFLISAELIYPDVDTRYTKGNRFTVDTYNPTTGDIRFYEVSYYDITSGYFWLNTVRPKVLIQDVSIQLVGNLDKKGLEVIIGEFYIVNAKITGFGRFCANISSSFGRVFTSQFAGELITGTTTGYSIQASGLSDIFVEGSNLYGSRHGIACGDVGYWQAADADAAPTPVPWVRLPAIVKMTGCRVAGYAYAVDSHAGTTLLDVYNCDIYGGAQVGGLETYITNSRIYQEPSQVTTLWFGRDRPTTSGAPFVGKYAVRNCQIESVSGVVNVFTNLEYLELSGLTVTVSPSGSARNMISYGAVAEVRDFVVDGIRHIGNVGDNVTYPFQCSFDARISKLSLLNCGALVSVRRNTVANIILSSLTVNNPGGNGIMIGALAGANRSFNVTVVDAEITGCATGLRITRARALSVNGGFMGGNASSIIFQSNSAGEITSVVNGVYFDQSTGNVVDIENGQAVSLSLIGNTFSQSASIGIPESQIVGKYGNIGLADKTTRIDILNNSFGGSTTSSNINSAYPGVAPGTVVYSQTNNMKWEKLISGSWIRNSLDIV